MMAGLARESRIGSLDRSKGLANVSKAPLARAGHPVDYTDPVTRHVRTTSAYRVYNQHVKNLNFPPAVVSSPASLGELTGFNKGRDAESDALQLNDV